MAAAASSSRSRVPRAGLSVGVAVTLLLSGCPLQTAPDRDALAVETLPNLKLPPAWVVPAETGPVLDNWIASVGGSPLEALVAEAIQHNADLRVAVTRIEQAAAGVRIAGGQMLPSVDLLARAGGDLGGDSTGISGWLLSASWELDLWGRVRYGKRAAEEQYASVEADVAAATQSVAALVAKAWFLASEARQQRALAASMVSSAADLLRVAEDRQRIGVGSELEVAQARASLQTLRDVERQLELAQSQATRSLETLLGRYPSAEIEAQAAFAALPASPAAGLPSELLERRPDVIAAQRRINAAFSRAGEADKARLPQLSLTAGASYIDSEVFVLQEKDYPVASLGANLFAPLFRGGALKAQYEARVADQKQAAAIWAQTGLKAFGEVENALATEAALRAREPLLAAATRDNDRALKLESERYRVGNRDLRSVLLQQMELYSSRSALLRVQAEQRVNRVNLHLALGGGFGSSPALLSATSP
jgi:NodT family efflux transporter outer membrane factor (OMF) lipoprotein